MNIRHGDMALIGIEKLPDGITASKSKVLMVGSGGNDHVFTVGKFYPRTDGQTVGYFEAMDGTKLIHPDHGTIVPGKAMREVDIAPGIYIVIKQSEDTHQGLKPVED